jgi:hypothetical protein
MYYAIKSSKTPEGKRKNIKCENWNLDILKTRRTRIQRILNGNDEITIYFFNKRIYDLHFYRSGA